MHEEAISHASVKHIIESKLCVHILQLLEVCLSFLPDGNINMDVLYGYGRNDMYVGIGMLYVGIGIGML